jgi:hypothetical protein
MSVVSISDTVISNVVEAMLPRFSAENLGVLVGVDMNLSDYGFGEDGNTQEREPLHLRKYLWFLFVRPNNYTKVYHWMPSEGAKGLDIGPIHKTVVWTEIADHDSCWREAAGDKMTKMSFDMFDKFRGRKVSGKDVTLADLSGRVYVTHSTPCYVKLDHTEDVYPEAERYSKESREKRVMMHRVEFKNIKVDDDSRLSLRE